MSRSALFLFAFMLVVAAAPVRPAAMRTLTPAEMEDRVRGGWAGQMIGVSYGARYEFRSLGKIIEGELQWSPEGITNSLNQDDLYVDMTFAAVMDRLGLDATTRDYGEAFKNSRYRLWHANAAARRLLNRGIEAPDSGHPKYNVHANDIDFQIESDFIGLMTPGLPRESNRYCDRIGRVMNYGDGLYGGMFVTGMYSAAFFEKDPRKIVEAGLACIPRESLYGKLIRDLLSWHSQHPTDWRKTWSLIQEKWDRDDPCPGGALQPFNIDASINGAYVAMGLLYGGGDFDKTMEVSIRCGQDADCNPASSAGILGVVLGYRGIPERWKSGIPAIADKKFAYTDYSFEDIIQSTLKRARKVVEKAGGKWTATEIAIPLQTPRSPKLEQWSMGVPDRIIAAGDPAWTWGGEWFNEQARIEYRTPVAGTNTSTPDAEATLRFTGKALLVVGPHHAAGGRADVYLDGKKAGMIDAFTGQDNTDEGLWHTYGLKAGDHTVRIVTRPDADPASKGKKVNLWGAITYR
jgi:hypothetical protein